MNCALHYVLSNVEALQILTLSFLDDSSAGWTTVSNEGANNAYLPG